MSAFAAFLSLLLPGLGQLCQGRVVPAFGFFVTAVFALILALVLSDVTNGASVVLLLVMAIWACVDAARYRPPVEASPAPITPRKPLEHRHLYGRGPR